MRDRVFTDNVCSSQLLEDQVFEQMLDHVLPQREDQGLVNSFESVLDHVDHVSK